MLKSIFHYGIRGMKWGVRKKQDPIPEHSTLNATRRKRLKDISNEELQAATKRLELIKKYRKGPTIKGGKRVQDLTNEELELEIKKDEARKKLLKGRPAVALKQIKDIDPMTIKEVNQLIERLSLEKKYKDLHLQDVFTVRGIVQAILKNRGS